MQNLSILFLVRSFDLLHSSLFSPTLLRNEHLFKHFSLSNSRFKYFSQSLILNNIATRNKLISISDSKFEYFLESPIHLHRDEDPKIKLFEDQLFSKKRFRIKGGDLRVHRCIFEKNKAKKGGGLNSEHNVVVNLTDCIFSSNIATFGGGIYIEQTEHAYFSNILIINNSAEYLGGVFLDGVIESPTPFSYFDNVNITHNCADEWTGGIRLDHGGGNFYNSVIDSCSARVCGGFFDQLWKPSIRNVHNSLFINNSAIERTAAYCAFHIMHQSKFSNCAFILNKLHSSSSLIRAKDIYVESIDSQVVIDNCFFDDVYEKSIAIRFDFSKVVLGNNNTFVNPQSNKVNLSIIQSFKLIPPQRPNIPSTQKKKQS